MFLYIIFSIALILLDRITKNIAEYYLMNKSPMVIIPSHLEFTYLENRGAAFGILQDKKTFFIIITFIVCLVILVFFVKEFNKLHSLSRLSLVMIFSGAVGNFIDRFTQGYVVDFIALKFGGFYNFPVFNVADICVTIGCSLLIVSIIKFDKFLGD